MAGAMAGRQGEGGQGVDRTAEDSRRTRVASRWPFMAAPMSGVRPPRLTAHGSACRRLFRATNHELAGAATGEQHGCGASVRSQPATAEVSSHTCPDVHCKLPYSLFSNLYTGYKIGVSMD